MDVIPCRKKTDFHPLIYWWRAHNLVTALHRPSCRRWVVLILIRITELHPFLVINIHLFESTLITELKSHFFCFLQVQWLIDNYETAEGVSLVHVPPCTPIIWDTAMSTSWSQSIRQTDPFRFSFWDWEPDDWAPGWNISFDFSKSFQIEFIYFLNKLNIILYKYIWKGIIHNNSMVNFQMAKIEWKP